MLLNNYKDSYKHIVALIYTAVLFLDRLDLTIVNIALPSIAKYFEVSMLETDWVNLAFLLSLAISIPISTWLGKRFGFKKMYISSIVVFGLGATLCFFSRDLGILIAMRFIQGLGGGMLIPLGMTLLYQAYEKSDYASITSFTFIPALVAPAIAPLLGGALSDTFGWQSVFTFSGPICFLLAVVAIIFLVKEDRTPSPPPLDWLGFTLSSSILIDSFLFFSEVSRFGLTPFSGFTFLLLTPLILTFITVEKKSKHPLIDLSYFKKKTFIKANLIQLCFQCCHFGSIFLIAMFLQVGVGISAFLSGLLMGMQAIGAMSTSRYSVKLFNKYGANLPIMLGMGGVAIVSPFIMMIDSSSILCGLILFFTRGVFSGLCGTPIQTLSIIEFEKKQIATVNSIFNACRQISISLGIAVSSILISMSLKNSEAYTLLGMTKSQAFQTFGAGFIAITGLSVLGILVCRIPILNRNTTIS